MAELLTEAEMRESMRNKYPDHFRHAWTLFEFAQEVLGNFKGTNTSPYGLSVWLIGGRAFKSYHAILNLCEIAHTEDAGVVLRSLFNLLVIERWISAQDAEARARRYLAWFWIVMHQDLERHSARISPDLAREVLKQYEAHKPLFEYTDTQGNRKLAKKWHEPEAQTIEQMAEQVDLKSHYDGLYRPLSSIEHSDALAYFAMVSQAETKDGGPSLAMHSDLFVPAYVRNGFQYFAEIFHLWNKTLKGAEEATLKSIIDEGMKFFKQETEEEARAAQEKKG